MPPTIRSPISRENRWARAWCTTIPWRSRSASDAYTQNASLSWCWRKLQWISLGRPWLTLHHPDIHWNSGEELKWSEYCLPPVLHPCAYFSKKMSPAEQNYDIGNCELLAIKLALEEWRHWLEGAQHPFEVITDHKNLQYLRDVKCLNPRQARWALFFTHFRFTVTYRPGHKNLKAYALSRLHQPDPSPESPEPILSPTVFVCPIEWALDDQIHAATLEEHALPGGPEGRSYVPTALRCTLLDSIHTSPGSGHPGSQRTLSLIRNRYWWPSMARDVALYIRGCSVRAITSTPRRLPEGKLVPLPIPRRPWSHIGIDFSMDIPSSSGYTTILVVVDRFSKACKLIPLRGLPTALEMAEALFHHVFWNFGIPEDNVSDRGPQFRSAWSWLLVPWEREGMRFSTCPSPAGSAEK